MCDHTENTFWISRLICFSIVSITIIQFFSNIIQGDMFISMFLSF
ncbi:unnamed protein product [Schistosoma margrebowiei]|uniref:Uncharacterized protein n=1 Tax=Schistosoma margrebowiei TaxID=48269 RepID=A0A183LWQ8_9TREM|nr:unnamed protein product [Schistosoma margrebowiei]